MVPVALVKQLQLRGDPLLLQVGVLDDLVVGGIRDPHHPPEVGAEPLHRKAALPVVLQDKLLGPLHGASGGIGALAADKPPDPQAALQAPLPQSLRGGEIPGLDGAGKALAKDLGKVQPAPPGKAEQTGEQLQEEKVPLPRPRPDSPEAAGEDAAEFQPVQKGHLDVGEDHVGTEGIGQFQSLLAVFRLPHQGEAQPLPVHLPADPHPDVLLVVHKQHPVQVHSHPPYSMTIFPVKSKTRGRTFSGRVPKVRVPGLSEHAPGCAPGKDGLRIIS